MPSYLITGCGRGLGLELAAQLASKSSAGNLIFASARGAPSPALQALIDSSSGRVVYVQLDTTSEESIKGAVVQVEKSLKASGAGAGLDVLINNAGVMEFSFDGTAAMTNLTSSFNANVLGVHLVTSAFMPLLRKGTEKKVFNISTTLGSIARVKSYKFAPAPAYKVTKAALNMLTVQYAEDYTAEGFTFVAISPGWLQTDLGGEMADLPVGQGAEAVLKIVHEKGVKDSGKFVNILIEGMENPTETRVNFYDGKEVSW